MLSYPTKRNEFEIHADLYNQLRSRGFNVRGEVKYKKSFLQKHKRGARFDLVLFNELKKAIAIIEVKDSARQNTNQEHSKAAHYESLTQLPQFTFFINDCIEQLSKSLNTIL